MKIFKNRLFIFILGGIFFSSIAVFAVTTISADKVTYTDKNNVERTVDKVLDELYSNLDGKIGTTYYSSSYGNQRLQTMSNSIQLPKAGKYLCTTLYTQATGNTSATAVNNESQTSILSITGCNVLENKDSYRSNRTSSNKLPNNESYFLVGLEVTSFECNIDNSSTIQASVASNVSSVVPWIMYTTCSEIK